MRPTLVDHVVDMPRFVRHLRRLDGSCSPSLPPACLPPALPAVPPFHPTTSDAKPAHHDLNFDTSARLDTYKSLMGRWGVALPSVSLNL